MLFVDIAIVGKESIKIKGKQASFVIDPVAGMSKVGGDAIILLGGGEGIDVSRVTDSRIILAGPGSYEVGGVKILGTKTIKGTIYKMTMDGITTIIGSSAEVKTEGFNACQVLIVDTTDEFSESFVTALEPKITILYGEKKNEAAKTLGVENVSVVSKLTVAKDKLPDEMETVVLG